MRRTVAAEPYRSELREWVIRQAAETQTAPPARSRRRPMWPLLLPTAAGAALVIAAVLLLVGGSNNGPARSAGSVLRASAVSLQRSGRRLTLGPRGALYTREIIEWRMPGRHRRLLSGIEERWIARDGSGRVLAHGGLNTPSSPWGSTTLRPARRPFVLAPWVSLSYAELQGLPRDPDRLARAVSVLAEQGVRAAPHTGFSGAVIRNWFRFQILAALPETPTPVAVRAAVYRALALTPGIKLTGTATDAAGRRGASLVDRVGAFRFVLIVDPQTGTLLQSDRTLLHRSAQAPGMAPGLVDRVTYLNTRVVRRSGR